MTTEEMLNKFTDEHIKDGADEHIDSLAKKYLNADRNPFRSSTECRMVYKIKPISVFRIN